MSASHHARPRRAPYCLDELPVVQQRLLVLDLGHGGPRLNLVPRPLQLLDLLLQLVFELLLLRGIARLHNLLVYVLKRRDAFCDFLEAFVNLLLEFPCGHGGGGASS